ncbi:MAG: cytidylate kinase-like family protein [Desulfobacterales bacterium]
MAVITISQQFGSGGKQLGQKIAEALGYVFADSGITSRIAEAVNVSETWVEHVEKEAGGKFLWIISQMVSKGLVNKILKDERGYIDESIYLDYLVVLIAQFAEEGNVVIMGRGSQYILQDHPDAIHILLVNSKENRIQRLMTRHNLERKQADQMVRSEDNRRTALYKKIGKTDYDRADLYDMAINMGRVGTDTARDMIMELIRQKEASTDDIG